MTGVSLVVIGASLGGHAPKLLLSGLPQQFRPPIVIVQHGGTTIDRALADYLGEMAPFPVVEPDDKERLDAGHVYLASADYHLLVEPGSFELSTEAQVNYSRPSIDVLFESAAETYGSVIIGVILSGTGPDGASGCRRIKERSGVVQVQVVKDCAGSIMPAAAIAATNVDRFCPCTSFSALSATSAWSDSRDG